MKQFDKRAIGPEWQSLVNDYPEIFLEPSPYVLEIFNEAKEKGWDNVPEKEEDLCNLRFSFEMRCGWEEIIREFCKDIRELIQRAKDNGHTVFYKTFILKEKFGEIAEQGDFYGPDRDLYFEDYRNISRGLEEKSMITCEITGRPGRLIKRKYWVRTLCEEEAEKWLNYEKI